MSDAVKEEKKAFRLATRSSPLAMIQAEFVKKRLAEKGELSVFHPVKTQGDRVQDRPLSEIGGKGLFIKELEVSLLKKEADFGVHSLKDLPCRLEESFELAAHLPRDFPHDILVVPRGSSLHQSFSDEESWLCEEDFKTLPSVEIATGSLRREALLRKANPNLKILPIRGNIGTRLAKLKSGYADALVLSEASLLRLPYEEEDFCFYRLDPLWFVPCAGQGVVVVESLKEKAGRQVFEGVHCPKTEACTRIERGVLESLGGSCLLPIGVYCQLKEEFYALSVFVSDREGKKTLRYEKEFPRSKTSETLVREVKEALLAQGVKDLLQSLGIEIPN